MPGGTAAQDVPLEEQHILVSLRSEVVGGGCTHDAAPDDDGARAARQSASLRIRVED
jgi:hypothetical protein